MNIHESTPTHSHTHKDREKEREREREREREAYLVETRDKRDVERYKMLVITNDAEKLQLAFDQE